MLVIEGGWPSVPMGSVASDQEKQRRYIERQSMILDRSAAVAWFQITFTDLDEAAYGFPPGAITPFSHLGLVDVNLVAKSALSIWDGNFSRPRR